ncbi:MAG: GAF domain-containing protein [Egicoccus sp.]
MLTAIGLACLVATLVVAPVLERRRRRTRQQRSSADVRVALLETARTLPGHDLPEAARLACEGLSSLGFDAAAVSVRRGRVMTPMHSVGLPKLAQPIPAKGSFSARCIDENRTLVVADYASLPTHRPDRAELRSVVLTPVRADGRPVATLSAARRRVDEPTPREIAIAETVAAHLGRVFATHERVAAQEELLARMRRLDGMRTSFVEQVSGELHDRVEVLRERSDALGRDLDRDHGPERVLADIAAQSADLGAFIDTMLDFSRFQADRPEPTLHPITIGELLAPLRRSGALATTTDSPVTDGIWVAVDGSLVRHALELLLTPTSDGTAPMVREEADRVSLVLPGGILDGRWRRDGLLASLAEQLLLAGGSALHDDGEVAVVLPRWTGA